MSFRFSSNMCALVYYLVALCSLSIVSIAEASKSINGFSIDLIHRDSPLSPFHNSSMTPSHVIKNAALRSIFRYNHVHLQVNEKESIETIIIPNGGDYLMKFYIGTPPVERLAIADTGSDLIWVQCSPCKNCFPQDTPLFEPNKSSTFTSVSCNSPTCTLLPNGQHRCGNSKKCEYFYLYGGKSYTQGELGNDAINFGSTTQGVTFPKSIFGCGTNNKLIPTTNGKITGLVGLGAGKLSLVSQIGDLIGHKFSYCLLPHNSNTTSKLKLGKEAIITGKEVVSTPLIIKPSRPSFYFVNLEGIIVGQKKVQTSQSNGNIILDSGTTLTLLEPTFYKEFETLVKEAIGVEAEQNPPPPFSYCFQYRDGINFTNIVFQFTGANVSLRPYNVFLPVDNYVCMAIVPTNQQGIFIFGNVAQINFEVEYDLEAKNISFAPTDCTKTR